jgi:hypothetical protein
LSGVLKTVGMVAGVVALAATGIGALGIAASAASTLSTIAQIASAVSVAAGVGAQLTAKKPAAQGSSTQITIGSSMPSPFIVGQSYYGGNRMHQVGYGSQNDVPNAYLLAVDVYGVAGPYTELVQLYADFTPINFDGSGKAIGH